MMRLALLSAAVVAALSVGPLSPRLCADNTTPAIVLNISDKLHQTALEAVGDDPRKAGAAIESLRGAGIAGLDALLAANSEALQKKMPAAPGAARVGRGAAKPAAEDPAWARIAAAIDAVAMQKDAYASRLYWYTDFEAAKAEARRQNKPILSLRMMGKLNEDLSCANSRFFRTTLYPDAEVSQYLRAHFILHWESVRPVPVITIDMGDGRKIVRTITGNSIHYVLDSKGRLVDGLPGLYGAKPFLAALDQARKTAISLSKTDTAAFDAGVKRFALERMEQINAAWAADASLTDATGKLEAPTQLQVTNRAKELASATSDELWAKIAAIHPDYAELDLSTRALIVAKNPAALAMPLAISKLAVESPLMKMIRNLQNSIVLDTVKNEYQMHGKIYQIMLTTNRLPLAAFNDKVYAEVFLTPRTDPWLGLAQPDVFAAIQNDGLVAPGAAASR